MIPSIANIRKAIYCLNKRLDLLEGGEYSNTVTELSNKVHALESLLDDDAQNPTAAIDKFNEIVAFLNSIDNTETLQELLKDKIFDISAYNNNSKYADLAAALGTNGANIPESFRKGGMSVKFVQSSDNKYVQYNYMGTETTGSPNPFLDATNWQGIDVEPTANSHNLVESGGTFKFISETNKNLSKKTVDVVKDISNEFVFIQSAGILASDGVYYSGSTYANYCANQKYVDISDYLVLRLSVINKNSELGLALYDSEKNLLRGFSFSSLRDEHALEENMIDLDVSDASYIRVTYFSDTYKTEHNLLYTFFCCAINYHANPNKDIDVITKCISEHNDAEILSNNIVFTDNKGIVGKGDDGDYPIGSLFDDTNWKVSEYVDISRYKYIKTILPNINYGLVGFVLYDDNKIIIQGVNYASVYDGKSNNSLNETRINVEGASYIRFTLFKNQFKFEFVGYRENLIGFDITNDFVFTQSAYLYTKNDGAYVVNDFVSNTLYSGWQAHKGYVDISKFEKLLLASVNVNSLTGHIFYDKNFNVLDVVCYRDIYAPDKPYRCADLMYDVKDFYYIRTCYYSNSRLAQDNYPKFKCIGYCKAENGNTVHDEKIGKIENYISESEQDTVLNVEDFSSIEQCMSFRGNIDGKVKIVFNRDCEISSAILIPSNTTVIINNCTIKQANNTFDNVFRSANVVLNDLNLKEIPSTIENAENISIIGIGSAFIKGPDTNRTDPTNHNSPMVTADCYGARTHMISLCFINGGEVSGLRIIRPRGWSICLEYCQNMSVHDNIVISTDMDKPYGFGATGDGVDLRSGCHDIKVYNISGSTIDDMVAVNTSRPGTYTEPDDRSQWSYPSNLGYTAEYSAKYGTTLNQQDQHAGDTYNIYIRNIDKRCTNTTGRSAMLRLNCKNAHELYNVIACDMTFGGMILNQKGRAVLLSAYGNGSYINDSIHDVYINNVQVVNAVETINYTLDSEVKVLNVWANKLVNESGGDIYHYLFDGGLVVTNS